MAGYVKSEKPKEESIVGPAQIETSQQEILVRSINIKFASIDEENLLIKMREKYQEGSSANPTYMADQDQESQNSLFVFRMFSNWIIKGWKIYENRDSKARPNYF